MDAARRATFQVVAWDPATPPPSAQGGCAVSVFRDAQGRLYLVTAAHCVPPAGPVLLRLVDHARRRFDGAEVLLLDAALDVAVLRVSGVPDDVPPGQPGEAHPAFPRTVLPYRVAREGEAVYCVGWPRLVDATSFSRGCVRSASGPFRPGDPASYLLLDAPIEPGNSGGGVFRAATGELLGVVSFRKQDAQQVHPDLGLVFTPISIAGAVPMRVLQQAMATVLYEARAPRWPVAYRALHLGLAEASLVGPALFRALVSTAGAGFAAAAPALAAQLAQLGRGGMLVQAAHASAPAAQLAGVPVAAAPDGQGNLRFSVLWAARHAAFDPQPVVLSEERPLDELLEDFALSELPAPARRPGVLARRRAPAEPGAAPLPSAPAPQRRPNPNRPALDALAVQLYLSDVRLSASEGRVAGGSHTNFRVVTAALPTRDLAP